MMLDRSLYRACEPHPGALAAGYSRAFSDVFELLRPLMADEETGGVLIIQSDGQRHVSLVGQFRKYSPESSYRIAAEKIKRTVCMRRRHGHVSAWQSANPARHKHAGCYLLADNLAVSFSGLSWEWDEAVLLAAAWLCGLLEPGEIDLFRQINHNPHISRAMSRVLGLELVPTSAAG